MSVKTAVRIVSGTLVVLALSLVVGAHTKLEKSVPADGATLTAAPSSVELVFNEKPDVKLTKIAVTGPSGKVALGPAHSMSEKSVMTAVTGPLADGKYAVTWQTSGDDGHVVKGAFSFSVKQTTTK
jgi:methionine-rich copper-binding protein CopC